MGFPLERRAASFVWSGLLHRSLNPVCSTHSHPFTQELEGDEEGEDEDDADINPKVSRWGAAAPVNAGCCVPAWPRQPCSSPNTATDRGQARATPPVGFSAQCVAREGLPSSLVSALFP